MLKTILSILISLNPKIKVYDDICNKNVDHLTYNQKISFQIGCSKVDGKRVYPNFILQGIYNEEKYSYGRRFSTYKK